MFSKSDLDTGYLFLFVLTPFVSWVLCGGIKFIVMGFKAGKFSFKNNGYGGFPSNHTAVVCSIIFMLILTRDILGSNLAPLLGVCLSFGFLFVQDALVLRRKIGKLVEKVNSLSGSSLVERTGHTFIEVLGGIFTGWLGSFLLYYTFKLFVLNG